MGRFVPADTSWQTQCPVPTSPAVATLTDIMTDDGCRRLLVSAGAAAVRPPALLLPGDGVRALLHDGLSLLDVLLAGPQGGEQNFNVEMFGGGLEN